MSSTIPLAKSFITGTAVINNTIKQTNDFTKERGKMSPASGRGCVPAYGAIYVFRIPPGCRPGHSLQHPKQKREELTWPPGEKLLQSKDKKGAPYVKVPVSSTGPTCSLVRDGQNSPHTPRLVVHVLLSEWLSPSPHANSFIIGPAVINNSTVNSGRFISRSTECLFVCM
jgi:hypothetical protein